MTGENDREDRGAPEGAAGRVGIIGLGYVGLPLVVDHARLVVDLRNAVRQRLTGAASGSVPANVVVL